MYMIVYLYMYALRQRVVSHGANSELTLFSQSPCQL